MGCHYWDVDGNEVPPHIGLLLILFTKVKGKWISNRQARSLLRTGDSWFHAPNRGGSKWLAPANDVGVK
jgi:hypothetical protein